MTLRPNEGVMESCVGMLSHLHVGRIDWKDIMLRNDLRRVDNPKRAFLRRWKEIGEPPLRMRDRSENSSEGSGTKADDLM